jgi:hypothetical protein
VVVVDAVDVMDVVVVMVVVDMIHKVTTKAVATPINQLDYSRLIAIKMEGCTLLLTNVF